MSGAGGAYAGKPLMSRRASAEHSLVDRRRDEKRTSPSEAATTVRAQRGGAKGNANLDYGPNPSGSIPSPVYVVTGAIGREAPLRRLPNRGARIELSAVAKDGSRRVYAALDLSERWAVETLMML